MWCKVKEKEIEKEPKRVKEKNKSYFTHLSCCHTGKKEIAQAIPFVTLFSLIHSICGKKLMLYWIQCAKFYPHSLLTSQFTVRYLR